MYEGQLVRLRPFCKEDAEPWPPFVNHPMVMRLSQTDGCLPYTPWDVKSWIEANSATKDLYNFAIETLAEGLAVGDCGITALSRKNRSCTVGIVIGDERYWGRGYGTDAMRILVRFLFLQMGMNRIALEVFSFNERARKSYEKIGFVRESTRRQSLFRDGQFHDEIIMSILRSEYDARDT